MGLSLGQKTTRCQEGAPEWRVALQRQQLGCSYCGPKLEEAKTGSWLVLLGQSWAVGEKRGGGSSRPRPHQCTGPVVCPHDWAGSPPSDKELGGVLQGRAGRGAGVGEWEWVCGSPEGGAWGLPNGICGEGGVWTLQIILSSDRALEGLGAPCCVLRAQTYQKGPLAPHELQLILIKTIHGKLSVH